MLKLLSSFSVLSFFLVQTLNACTIFSVFPQDEHWIGRTFDWKYGHGLVYVNKKNVKKKSLSLLSHDVSMDWTSLYGSVTFNQFGLEFPVGGMNEKGLVVEALQLNSSEFPENSERPSFNELQFGQYLLDNFSTIDDVENALNKIRISSVGAKLHYFVCDINSCMTIEFLGKKLIVHMREKLPISSLANNSYEEHVKYASQFEGFGGTKKILKNSKKSQDRFVRATLNALNINNHVESTEFLFELLADVGTRNNRWQIIYNQEDKIIEFRTTFNYLKRKIKLNDFNLSCALPNLYFDLNSNQEGDLQRKFSIYDETINEAVIKKSVRLELLPPKLISILSHYPKETTCLVMRTK